MECDINYPVYKGKRATMWNLIPQKGMPPTRLARYCCEVLKETAGQGKMIATGVRWDESQKRSTRGIYESLNKNKDKRIILMNDNDDRRQLFERCQLKAKTAINPIIDWSNREIWEFIRAEGIEYNPLYDCGFNRVGCIGCPMAGKGRKKEFAKWPAYKRMYIHAFDRTLKRKPMQKYKTGEEVFAWWMEEDLEQLKLFDMEVI